MIPSNLAKRYQVHWPPSSIEHSICRLLLVQPRTCWSVWGKVSSKQNMNWFDSEMSLSLSLKHVLIRHWSGHWERCNLPIILIIQSKQNTKVRIVQASVHHPQNLPNCSAMLQLELTQNFDTQFAKKLFTDLMRIAHHCPWSWDSDTAHAGGDAWKPPQELTSQIRNVGDHAPIWCHSYVCRTTQVIKWEMDMVAEPSEFKAAYKAAAIYATNALGQRCPSLVVLKNTFCGKSWRGMSLLLIHNDSHLYWVLRHMTD